VRLIKFSSAIILSILFLLQSCKSNDFSEAENVIKHIEKHKRIHSEYPISLEEIEMNNFSGLVYYDRLNDYHYQMFYKDNSGDFWKYSTLLKEWKYCSECPSMFENQKLKNQL